MSSLATNPNMTPSEILSLNLNDSALDLLNAAIASHHQVKPDNEQQQQQPQPQHKNSVDSNTTEDEASSTSPVTTHAKRELDKDDQVVVAAPKRAGRKPLDKSQIPDSTLDPKQKRKAQNRAAQRAFRDRKEKHVAELQARIDELEALNAVKDEDLIAENKKLKEMLQQLKEENYALKGAQFTFEFPVHDTAASTTTATAISTSPKSDMNPLYNSSGNSSSMSSGNSYSGNEDMVNSPLSNSHTQEDDSTSADTPTTSSNLFSSEPMQFGLIHDQPHQNSLDFLAITDVSQFGLGNGLSTSQNFPTSTNEANLSNVDLFNGKDDLFTNYRLPNTNTSTTNDEFLFANEDLTNLFGGNNDLFGFNNQQFAFNNAQFGLPEVTPKTLTSKDKKQLLLEKVIKGKEEGQSFQEISQDLQDSCPDFNLDLLCDEMKRKATCTVSKYHLTDYDVDAFVKCLDRY